MWVQKVECSGLWCWADGARFIPDRWNHDLAVLSVFGPRNAVRAAWARLAQRRHGSLTIGQSRACLVEGEKYVTIQTPMTRQMLHLIVIHPAATHQYTPFAKSFLLVGPEPEVRFFGRLNRMCPIPFRPAWREALWAMGREHGLIQPMPGFGLPGYKVDVTEAWAPLIKSGIENGGLV